jgi:hypothetical protein
MPFIRVNCPKGAPSSEQKPHSRAGWLVQALMGQGIDPVTEIGTAQTGFFFTESDVDNCFPGGLRYPSISTRCSDRRGGPPRVGLWAHGDWSAHDTTR